MYSNDKGPVHNQLKASSYGASLPTFYLQVEFVFLTNRSNSFVIIKIHLECFFLAKSNKFPRNKIIYNWLSWGSAAHSDPHRNKLLLLQDGNSLCPHFLIHSGKKKKKFKPAQSLPQEMYEKEGDIYKSTLPYQRRKECGINTRL